MDTVNHSEQQKQPMDANPAALMQQAARGNSAAFGQLYTQYLTPIYRFIFFRVRSKHDADDLTQTVFLKAYDHISDFKTKPVSPLAYFYTIARNTVIDYWRKKKDVRESDVEGVFDNVQDEEKDPDELAALSMDSEKLKAAIVHLTEEQQEVIILRFLNDCSSHEIAKIMSKTETAVRQLQCRALKTLRIELKDVMKSNRE